MPVRPSIAKLKIKGPSLPSQGFNPGAAALAIILVLAFAGGCFLYVKRQPKPKPAV